MKKRTPIAAVAAFCRQCVQSKSEAVLEACGGHLVLVTGQECPLYPFRLGRRPPVRALREQCLDCMGGSPSLVRECGTVSCAVHPYRMGKNPARQRVGGRREMLTEAAHVNA
jgi:hypothetical protein